MKTTAKTSISLTQEDRRILDHLCNDLKESRNSIVRRALLYFYMYIQSREEKKP